MSHRIASVRRALAKTTALSFASAILIAFAVCAHAGGPAELVWDGGGLVDLYDLGDNWDLDQIPTDADNVTFDLDITATIILGAPSNANDFTVADGDWTFTGGNGTALDTEGLLTVDDAFAGNLAAGAFVTLTGPANWHNAGNAILGDAGFGSLTINSGADFTASQILVGNQAGAEGELTVTGAGSLLTASLISNTGVFTIGNNGGTGTLNVLDGADMRTTSTSANDIRLGSGVGSTGTLNVDGAGSFAETEDIYVGYGGTGFLNITNGGQIINTDGGTNGSPDTVFGLLDASSSGAGVVDGDGSWLRSRSIFVGDVGTGRLEVRAGGVAQTWTQGSSIGDMWIGDDATADGKVAVFGSGASASLLDVDNSLYVGNAGLGVLHVGRDLDGNAVGSGALQVDVDLRIGDDSTNTNDNRVVIHGANTTANVDNVTYAGLSGTGTLEVTGGALFTGRFLRVGQNSTSNGTLLIDGPGSLIDTDADASDVTDDTVIGTTGTGMATISNGGRLNTDQLWVGYQGTVGSGTLLIDGGTVNAGVDNQSSGSDVIIGGRTDGAGGTGTVTIQNGGVMTSAVQTVIGGNSTGVGSLTVTGVGSLFDNDDNNPGGASNDILRIGQAGAGTAEVLDGGRIEAEGILIGNSNNGLAASLTVRGNNAGTPSTVETGGYLYVGNSRKGTMTVDQGAQVKVATNIATERIFIGDDNSADGSKLTISDPGSRVEYHGIGDVSVGNAGGSTTNRAVLEVLNGGVFSAVQRNPDDSIASEARIIVGDVDNGNGHVIVDGTGSQVESSAIYVGDGTNDSSGILDITNGGVATTTGEFQAGSNGNGVGEVNVMGPGSMLDVGTTLSLGDDIPGNGSATGELNVVDGGTVQNGATAYVGHYTGSFGTANVGSATSDASSWSIGNELIVAGTETSSQLSGFGLLNVDTGGVVDVATNLIIRNLGDVNLTGGEIVVGDIVFTDAGSTFDFNSGTLRFSGNKTLNPAALDGIFNGAPNPTLGAGQHLAIDGAATLGAPLRMNDSTAKLSIGTIANLANLDWDAGELSITAQDVVIGGAGLFGGSAIIHQDQALRVSNNTLTVEAGSDLNVIRGGLSAADMTNDGLVVISNSTDVDFDADASGPGLTNNGDLVLIESTVAGDIENNGQIELVGNVTFDGDAAFTAGGIGFDLHGTASGEFDALAILGDAALGGALDVSVGANYSLSAGDTFKIMDVVGTLSGAFSGLVDGALVGTFGGVDLFIDYGAGDGNDVVLTTMLSVLQADFDADGDVDGDDFLAWQGGFGTTSGAMKSDGDFDNDGDVDGDDFLGWQSEFGSGAGSGAVPEPSSMALIALAAICVGLTQFRKRIV